MIFAEETPGSLGGGVCGREVVLEYLQQRLIADLSTTVPDESQLYPIWPFLQLYPIWPLRKEVFGVGALDDSLENVVHVGFQLCP